MMSGRECYTPIRPPRGSKVSKDTSGRLMNIIAELSVSKTNDDRQRKMKELKNDFQVSEAKLIKLISDRRQHLSVIMENFSNISAKINTSRTGCQDAKEKIRACQKLLECRREDIRRLYSESVEHREVINMLNKIEDLSKVKDKIQNYLKQGKFNDATELLVSKTMLLNGKLASVDALKDVKSQLNTLSESLHQVLVQKIEKHLYMMPEDVFLNESKMKNYMYEDVFKKKYNYHELPIAGKSYKVFEKDANYEHFSVLLTCISRLNRLSETVEVLKEQCHKQLMKIIRNSSQLMLDMLNSSGANCEEKYFMSDLLNCIINQFKHVAINYQNLLDNLDKIKASQGLTDVNYDIADVYSQMQAAMQILVSSYVGFQSSHTERDDIAQRVSSTALAKVPTSADLSSYFLRRDVNRAKKNVLFKFDCSSHAISMKSYLEEKKDSVKSEKHTHQAHLLLICQPMARNIADFYIPLKNFIFELQTALNMESGSHCPLHVFLSDCVNLFLDEINCQVNRMIEKNVLSHSFETYNFVTDVLEDYAEDTKKKYKAQILNSTLSINSCLDDMKAMIQALPDFASHFQQLSINVLLTYKELCQTCYKALIYPNTDEKNIFSVSYARDGDIARLLRSLPNWRMLDEERERVTHEFESPEDIRFRNKEECELLIRNLSCKEHVVSSNEIITDYKMLKNLALMHESMEWLSRRVLEFCDSLFPEENEQNNNESSGGDLEKLLNESDNESKTNCGMSNVKVCLKNFAEEFEHLADTCLLVLHLEVRVHCFYFLFPLYKQMTYVNRKDDHEAEPDVLKLNQDLCHIDEAISPVLQAKKMKYIFEGLGELLATILINSVSNIKKINENGVKKMVRNIFVIQQNLASITMTREVALDRARQYFELLNHSFEDILNQIVEEGPQFQEQEYSAIIQLLHNSREGMDSLSNYKEKLRQILDEVAVSV